MFERIKSVCDSGELTAVANAFALINTAFLIYFAWNHDTVGTVIAGVAVVWRLIAAFYEQQ